MEGALLGTRPGRMQVTVNTIQALIAIGTGIAVSLAVLGSGAWWWQKGWRELAEVRGEKIEELEKEISGLKGELMAAKAEAEGERAGLREQMAHLIAAHARDQESTENRIAALEGMLSAEQRVNHRLQLRLDEAEKKISGDHEPAA